MSAPVLFVWLVAAVIWSVNAVLALSALEWWLLAATSAPDQRESEGGK